MSADGTCVRPHPYVSEIAISVQSNNAKPTPPKPQSLTACSPGTFSGLSISLVPSADGRKTLMSFPESRFQAVHPLSAWRSETVQTVRNRADTRPWSRPLGVLVLQAEASAAGPVLQSIINHNHNHASKNPKPKQHLNLNRG